MVLWQSDLRISWRAQWFSLLLHGVVAALVLLVPWPLSYTPDLAAAVVAGSV
ncbi:protein YgfX [Klebsiella variicola subsp. variicola]|nr:protein YgfX [Klebsiella variicola subsp. variicola]